MTNLFNKHNFIENQAKLDFFDMLERNPTEMRLGFVYFEFASAYTNVRSVKGEPVLYRWMQGAKTIYNKQ